MFLMDDFLKGTEKRRDFQTFHLKIRGLPEKNHFIHYFLIISNLLFLKKI